MQRTNLTTRWREPERLMRQTQCYPERSHSRAVNDLDLGLDLDLDLDLGLDLDLER